jgi:hypothetical protein
VDLPEDCLVVALAEFIGILEGTLMGKSLDEEVGGRTELAKGFQGTPRTFGKARSAPRAAVLPRAPEFSSAFCLVFVLGRNLGRSAVRPSQSDRHGASNSIRLAPQTASRCGFSTYPTGGLDPYKFIHAGVKFRHLVRVL